MPRLPRIFIASSREGLQVARCIRSSLSHDASVTMWDETYFQQGIGTLEHLVKEASAVDFAVFVASADDRTESRGTLQAAPRDNILFEFGLFMGKLGRECTFLVRPNTDFKLPSDLSGITTLLYDPKAFDSGSSLHEQMAAVGPACDVVRHNAGRWRDAADQDVLTAPGLLQCFTNATDAQAAIGRAIAQANATLFFAATNLSYTPVLNVAELQGKLTKGVSMRFLILNPISRHIPMVAKDFLIPPSQLLDEGHLHLKTLIDLRDFAISKKTAGQVSVRLYDTAPRMRAYVFDDDKGTSFFVPYVNRATSRPLPVYHCANSMVVARTYINGLEQLWNADDVISVEEFIQQNPDFIRS